MTTTPHEVIPDDAFRVTTGAPTRIEITRADGSKWILSVVLGVHQVKDMLVNNPDGTPKFDLRISLSTDTQAVQEARARPRRVRAAVPRPDTEH